MCRGWPRAPTPRHAASGPRRARRANGSAGRSRTRRSSLDCTTAATIAAFWTSPSTRTSASLARCPRACTPIRRSSAPNASASSRARGSGPLTTRSSRWQARSTRSRCCRARFLLVSLRPAMPFDDMSAPMRERLTGLPFGRLAFDAAGARDYFVNANWALYIDNYLEGFHIPYVHSGLAGVLDYGEYAVELDRYAVLQLGVAKQGERTITLPAAHLDTKRRIAAYYYWLFPTTMFNVYPWGVSVNVVTPLAVDRTRVSFLPFVWDESAREQGAGAGLDRVEREDEAIVESVQRGTRSRLYERGRYSPTRETGVHHFHRLLAEFLR